MHAVLSSPLLANGWPVGALNLYSRTPGAFGAKDRNRASVFAAEASVLLSDMGVDDTAEQLGRRLTEALETRELVALAQGVLMERHSISTNAAYETRRGGSSDRSSAHFE
jgi:hypothetical protein